MRMIGHLTGEANARAFGDFLLTQGIDSEVEPDKDDAWTVWIHAEEDVERAKTFLAAYQQNPNDPKFQQSAQAAAIRENRKKDQSAYERRLRGRRQLFRSLSGYGFGPVTFMLLFACVVVFVVSGFGKHQQAVYALYISEVDFDNVLRLSTWNAFLERVHHIREVLPEVRRGEVWRLFTPMLVHMDPLHIFFNMLWLIDLGSMIEGRQKSWLLVAIVLAIAFVSNVAQFFVSGPGFGGMSGVVYGLLGYVWIRGKLDPGSGLYLHKTNVVFMIIWLFACMFHMAGDIANTAHAAGLVMGMAWGWLSSLRHR